MWLKRVRLRNQLCIMRNSDLILTGTSTLLCFISLFSGCWNIAYSGDPLCWDWGAHAKIAVLMPRLWCSCQDCGALDKIAVLMPRLRCSCQDWGAHAEIEVLKSPQSWPEHRNLGMSTSNSAWAPQSKHSIYLCIWGRHHQLDYLTRPRKPSWATN